MAVENLQFKITAIDKTRRAFSAIQNRLKGLGRVAKVAAVAVAGVGVAAAAMVNKTVGAADEIAKTADKLGLSTKSLQEFRISADLAGISSAELTTALGAMEKRIGELRAGTGSLQTFLKKTDPEFAKILKSTTSNDEAFRLLIERISSYTSAQDRAALSAAAFSRSAGIALSKLSLDELNKGIETARRFGLIIDEELLRNAEKIQDQFTIAAKVIEITFMREVLKAMQDVDLTNLVEDLSAIAKASVRAARSVAEFFGLLDKGGAKHSFEMSLPPQNDQSLQVTMDRANGVADATVSAMDGLDDLGEKIEETIPPLKQFQNAAADTFTQLQDVGVSAMRSTEDAILSFVNKSQTAAQAFKNLASGIINDLIRMQIRSQITGPLSGFLNEMFSSTSSAGTFGPEELDHFARGGVTSPHKPYLVGEKGPEIFMPGVTGRVVPNGASGGGAVTVNVINNTSAQTRVEETNGPNGRSIDVIIDEIVARQISRPGTAANQALRSNFGASPLLAGR